MNYQHKSWTSFKSSIDSISITIKTHNRILDCHKLRISQPCTLKSKFNCKWITPRWKILSGIITRLDKKVQLLTFYNKSMKQDGTTPGDSQKIENREFTKTEIIFCFIFDRLIPLINKYFLFIKLIWYSTLLLWLLT